MNSTKPKADSCRAALVRTYRCAAQGYRDICACSFVTAKRLLSSNTTLIIIGISLLIIGLSLDSNAWTTLTTAAKSADSSSSTTTAQATQESVAAVNEATCWLLYFQEGSFGGLLIVVSGLSAIVTAAMGAYKTALNCVIVGCGCWLIRPVSTLLFDYSITNCSSYITLPSS